MLARIWWKEARTLWPLWAAVATIAAVTAGCYWRYGEIDDLRNGALLPILSAISLLYAFAVGATTFAGERETKTLLFLDALPVPRGTLWRGKASFAYASVVALFLVCILLALSLTFLTRGLYGTPPLMTNNFGPVPTLEQARLWTWMNRLCLFGIEAVAWGLFWSALKENVLTVAILSILSVAGGELAFTPFTGGLGELDESNPLGIGPPLWLLRGGSAAFALIASWFAVTRAPRPERVVRPRRIGGIISLAWKPLGGVPSTRGKLAAAVTGGLALLSWWGTYASGSQNNHHLAYWLATFGILLTILAGFQFVRLASRYRHPGFLYLVWETFREARGTWLRLLGAGVLAVVFFAFTVDWYGSARGGESLVFFILIVAACLSLVAGVHVFGITNGRGERRFLAHHGVHAGTAWLAKTLVWAVPTAAVTWVLIFPATLPVHQPGMRPNRELSEVAWLVVPGAFVIGQLCGMVVPRMITACMIGVLGLLTVLLPLLVLYGVRMASAGFVALVLLAFPAISWAWSDDWLVDRPSVRRWLKLGGLLILAAGPLFGLYVVERVRGVPDFGQPFAFLGKPQAPKPAPGQDATVGYRAAAKAFKAGNVSTEDWKEVDAVGDRGWDPGLPAAVAYWKVNEPAIDLARRASSLPHAAFTRPTRLDTPLDPFVQDQSRHLARLLALDGRERLFRGDLEGSWGDALALFRMARHIAEGGGYVERLIALSIEFQGTLLAFDWASDGRQTAKSLRAALDSVRGRPVLPPIGDAIIAEAATFENTLDRPAEELRPMLEGKAARSLPERLVYDVIYSPWERERTRRVLRLAFARTFEDATRIPWGATGRESVYGIPPLSVPRDLWTVEHRFTSASVDQAIESTPLARLIMPANEAVLATDAAAVVRGRALEIVLALRTYQAEHGGHYPTNLSMLLANAPTTGTPKGQVAAGMAGISGPSSDPLARGPYLHYPSTQDPYSGGIFGYLQAHGRPVPRLGRGNSNRVGSEDHVETRPGQWLLYSVGPNGRDDRAVKDSRSDPVSSEGDLIFPLPDTEPPAAPAASAPPGPGAADDRPPAMDGDAAPRPLDRGEPAGGGAGEDPGVGGVLRGGGGAAIKPLVEVERE